MGSHGPLHIGRADLLSAGSPFHAEAKGHGRQCGGELALPCMQDFGLKQRQSSITARPAFRLKISEVKCVYMGIKGAVA